MNIFKRKPSDVLRASKHDIVARRFLGLDDEIPWETRGVQARDLPVVKTMADLDAFLFVLKDYTTVVISVEEVRLFNAANHEEVRFRFPRKFYFSEDLEEQAIRKSHSGRMKMIHAITAPSATGSAALTTVSFIPGEVDHVEFGMHVLRECWRTELAEFCATLHQNPNLRNVHIATKLCEGEGFNLDQLLNSFLEEISLPDLREQGWRDLALGLARNRSVRVLTLRWNAEGMEKFVQTRLDAEYDSDVTWTMCNTTLETLVIACPRELDLQSDSKCVASMLHRVSSVSTFVIEYSPPEPAPSLTRFASHLRQALSESTTVQALHLHIPFHGREIEHILNSLFNPSAPHSPPANTTLTGLVLVPDKWTKSDLDAVGNMLKNNTTIKCFGIRNQNPRKKLSFWRCLQRIGESEIVEFLVRLCANSTLQSLTLRGWGVVDGKRVLAAVLDLLRNQPRLDIDLTGTGLASKNMLEPVISQLQKNKFISEIRRNGSARSNSSHAPSPHETLESPSHGQHGVPRNTPLGSVYITTINSHASSASASRLSTQDCVMSEHNEDSAPGSHVSTSTNSIPEAHPEQPRRHPSQPHFFCSFTLQQLEEATLRFQTPLGEGGFGVVYEGQLQNHTRIAVKDLKFSNRSSSDRQRIQRSFAAEVQTLGLIHHVNLVRLLGYCTQNERHMLVYEFMANSSLDKWIFGDDPRRQLDWVTRIKIAVGIARGLEYLHAGCSQAIVHLDIKPQNILLDAQLNPKLADFGIAKLVDMEANLATISVAQGTRSYMAPEIHLIGAVSAKTDVFSFGILLMEIIRGKRNGNLQLPDEDSKRFFPSWAKNKFRRGRYMDAVHELKASLSSIPGFQTEEAKKLLCIAISCIHDDMHKRPDMKRVLLMLEDRMKVPSPPVRNRNSISSNANVRPR